MLFDDGELLHWALRGDDHSLTSWGVHAAPAAIVDNHSWFSPVTPDLLSVDGLNPPVFGLGGGSGSAGGSVAASSHDLGVQALILSSPLKIEEPFAMPLASSGPQYQARVSTAAPDEVMNLFSLSGMHPVDVYNIL